MPKEIKYSDKSKDQPRLVNLFNEVKEIMRPFAKGNYLIHEDKPGNYGNYYNTFYNLENYFYACLCNRGCFNS
jgi:hypothetical protein